MSDVISTRFAPRAGRRTSIGVSLAGIALLALIVVVLRPQVFTSHAPDDVNPLLALRPPGAGHPFGTDQLGRDVFTRVLYGARISLVTGLAATGLAVAAGTLLGLLAALGARAVEEVVMRTVDTLLALPGLLLALLVVATAGPGPVTVLAAIAVAETPGYARLIRGQALVVTRSGYVLAARALGVRRNRIVLRHVLPNVLGPLLALVTIGVGTTIIMGSSLSFLGLGPRQPSPEWGAMLADGRDFIGTAWWLATFPGLAITAVVMVLTVLGRRLRASMEGGSGR
jgi:peptide/nickel transport system permease protein